RGSTGTKPQQGPKTPRIPCRRRTTMAATADDNAQARPKRPVTPPILVQQAGEALLAFLKRLQFYLETTAAELSKWEEEEAARQQEIQRQLAEAEAARQQAAAEAAAAARLQQQQVEASQNQVRYQATMELANEETTYRRILRQQHLRANEEQEEPTEEERNKDAATFLMENLLYTCNWQQREVLAMRCSATAFSNDRPLLPRNGRCQTSRPIRCNGGWLSTRRLDALYLQLIGAAQAFMTHMAVTLECTIATLHTKITWEEFKKKWKTQFMVNNDKRHVLNKIFRMFQGQQPSREWLTEWQRLIATSELNLPFDAIGAEFVARSCDALTTFLGSGCQYKTFDDMISKARELIQGNWRAANEARQQPGYVEKGKGQTPQVAAIQQGSSEDLAAVSTSSDGDVAAMIPPQRSRPRGGKHKRMPRQGQGKCQASGLGKLSTGGSAATSLPSPSDSAALLAVSLTSGDTAAVASSRIEFENYAVELVPPLNQPLHMQDSSACVVVPPSSNEPVASPALLWEDPSTWASLEELDPLMVEDFQWLPLPSTGFLPTPHCNALMAHLREYLHAAVPPLSTDGGVAVVDLRNYLAKFDREHATQRTEGNCLQQTDAGGPGQRNPAICNTFYQSLVDGCGPCPAPGTFWLTSRPCRCRIPLEIYIQYLTHLTAFNVINFSDSVATSLSINVSQIVNVNRTDEGSQPMVRLWIVPIKGDALKDAEVVKYIDQFNKSMVKTDPPAYRLLNSTRPKDWEMFPSTGRTNVVLDWRKRLDIAIGTADGLTYLHNHADPPIIHRDIKPSNILLDDNMIAKLGDFGISRMLDDPAESAVFTRVAGTLGYLDPMYHETRSLTDKSDVFSFGVVLLELVSGKDPSGRRGPLPGTTMVEWAENEYTKGGLEAVIDPALKGQYPYDTMCRIVELGLWCTRPTWDQRPTMKDVLNALEVAKKVANKEAVAEDGPTTVDVFGRHLFQASGGKKPEAKGPGNGARLYSENQLLEDPNGEVPSFTIDSMPQMTANLRGR
ncbi:hypothetical protein CBR_g37222, partial [Chara braunii]